MSQIWLEWTKISEKVKVLILKVKIYNVNQKTYESKENNNISKRRGNVGTHTPPLHIVEFES